VESLPPNGIAIQVLLTVEHPPVAKPMRWPPRIDSRDVAAPFEGLPRRIGVFQWLGRVGRYEPYVFVFFGRPHPTARQLARANDELSTARLR
jgi:hypothetical protein